MEDTTATHGAYGLGLMPTGGNANVWGPGTQAAVTVFPARLPGRPPALMSR
jgi:hypothetical protein